MFRCTRQRSFLGGGQRQHNRIVMLCASINDVSAWPFWKFLQLKKVKGVTDLHMLAFNSEGGSFLARVDGTEYSVKNYEKVVGYHQQMMEEFVDKTYDKGRTYFVYGGHGMGDYLELEEFKVGLQIHDLANLFGSRTYEGILFDACFMANLDCAYYLRNNTKWIGACEGYMWEEDVALDRHVFNTYTASAMSRFKDPKNIFEAIQRDYCNKTSLGDFSVINTEHVAELWEYVEKNVWQRVYDNAVFLSDQQHEELQQQAGDAIANLEDYEDLGSTNDSTGSTAFSGGKSAKRRLLRAIQFQHALYPSEYEDKHLVDLREYLIDIARDDIQSVSTTSPAQEPEVPAVQETKPAISAEKPKGDTASGTDSTDSSDAAHRQKREIPSQYLEHEGLRLLSRVVSSHIPPQDNEVYSTPLGGLSLSVHEYSPMSVLHRQRKVPAVNRTKLSEKANEFLSRQVSSRKPKSQQSQPNKTEGPLTSKTS